MSVLENWHLHSANKGSALHLFSDLLSIHLLTYMNGEMEKRSKLKENHPLTGLFRHYDVKSIKDETVLFMSAGL